MGSAVSIRIEGLRELMAKANAPHLLNAPMRNFWNRCGIAVQNRARVRAPVDTGRLRASIATELDTAQPPMYVKIGTPVFYAPFMEYGTGAVGDGDVAHVSWHYPPAEALGPWAGRHGATGGQIAAAIGKRGGLLPRRYLRGALEDSLADIRGYVVRLGQDIKAAWDGR